MSGLIYENRNLCGEDFSGKDLSGAEFKKCTFSDVNFKGANVRGARFISCKNTGELSFERADMRGVELHRCTFRSVSFKSAALLDATICNTDLSGSRLIACRFNGSFIDGLNVSRCNMNMATFLDTQIMAIEYMPVRHMPYMRGLRPFRRTQIQHNTIFINGNQHLEFAAYCNSEARKDRFFSTANSLNPLLHPFAYIILALFGLLTDFGQSFSRWLLCVVAIVAFFAVGAMFLYGTDLSESVLNSMLAFFGFGEIRGGYTYPFVIESVVGYFMLGMLISLLTTKLSID